MRDSVRRSLFWLWIFLGFLLGVASRNLRAQETVLELDPANTTVQFSLDATLHTVHGTFKLKGGTIHFNPATGTASGQVTVDATSGDTDNDSRDHKMHKSVLESAKYPEITFTPTKVKGALAPNGDSTVQVEGVFRLHGTDHPISASVPVQLHGNVLSTKTHLVIPYVDWGLKNPSTFFLHVSDKVEVEVSATGHLTPAGGQP
ncbi:MAG: YceI family protein [Acidobacteriia bacterium]|nr:YceI family protein [Terriglobia bacterium]